MTKADDNKKRFKKFIESLEVISSTHGVVIASFLEIYVLEEPSKVTYFLDEKTGEMIADFDDHQF